MRQELRQVEGLFLQCEFACLDFGQVQRVIDQVEQGFGIVPRNIEQVAQQTTENFFRLFKLTP